MNPLPIPPGFVLAASFAGTTFLEFNRAIEIGVVEVSGQTVRRVGFYVQDFNFVHVGDVNFPDNTVMVHIVSYHVLNFDDGYALARTYPITRA